MKETEVSVDKFNELKNVLTVMHDHNPEDIAGIFCRFLEENGFDVEMFYNHQIPSQSYRIKRKPDPFAYGSIYIQNETLELNKLRESDYNRFQSKLERGPHTKGTLTGQIIVKDVVIATFTETHDGKFKRSAVDPNFDEVYLEMEDNGLLDIRTYGPTPTIVVSYDCNDSF